MSDKSILRIEARARRKALVHASPGAAHALASFGRCLSTYRVIAVYNAIGAELNPEPLAQALQAAGSSLCLPVVEAGASPMIFRLWVPGDPLVRDAAGCLVPLAEAVQVDPDLVLAPLLAFDKTGTRLGQGGGYYDRTFQARPQVARIGVAYAGQEVDWLPAEAHDKALHGVLTEVGYRTFDGSG